VSVADVFLDEVIPGQLDSLAAGGVVALAEQSANLNPTVLPGFVFDIPG
jgi:hypothetical protein